MPAPELASMTGQALIREVQQLLSQYADPERAVAQQRYMKSAMPYRGLSSPLLRSVLRQPLNEHRLGDEPAWRATVLTLWDGAGFREERYAALALARHRFYRVWARDPSALVVYEHLVRTGAWWDLVDETATHLVGGVLAEHSATAAVIRRWAHQDDLWVRRSAIICQLSFKDRTDLDLLSEAIEASIGDRDFFARKAIGWALREYAKTDPGWVVQFCRTRPALSGLSRREAMKNLGSAR